MASSAEAQGALARVEAVCRLLMQVRLLLVGVTLLLLAGAPFTVSSGLALAAAAFCSWLGARYSRRIVDVVVRHPILLGLDVVASFVVLELGGPLGPFFLYTVVTAAVAGLLFRWRGVAYFCSLQVLCYFVSLGLTEGGEAWSFQAMLGQPAYYPLVGFVGVRVRGLLDQQALLAEERRRAEVDAAAADERARLARELHDSLAKTLRGIAMSAKALPMWMGRSPDRAADEAQRMASAAEVASREARDLISGLRCEQLDQPLDDAIRDMTESWAQATGISVRAAVTERVDLPVLARYEAMAIVEECLTNIERHSCAAQVDVRLAHEDGQWVLTVHDDGMGFQVGSRATNASAEEHYGVVGMHERAGRAGGTLNLTSSPGQGTTVRVTFPVEPRETRSVAPGAAPSAELDTERARGRPRRPAMAWLRVARRPGQRSATGVEAP